MKIDTSRPLVIFTSEQVHDAGKRVIAEAEKQFKPELAMAVEWGLAKLMCELGIHEPEDFYLKP